MDAKTTLSSRILRLCEKKRLAIGALATRAGASDAEMQRILQEDWRDVPLLLVKKLCDGLDMSLAEFFTDFL